MQTPSRRLRHRKRSSNESDTTHWPSTSSEHILVKSTNGTFGPMSNRKANHRVLIYLMNGKTLETMQNRSRNPSRGRSKRLNQGACRFFTSSRLAEVPGTPSLCYNYISKALSISLPKTEHQSNAITTSYRSRNAYHSH